MLRLLTLFLYLHVATAKLFFIEVKYPLLGIEAPPGAPWPQPRYMSGTSNNISYFDPNKFHIVSNLDSSCDIISANIVLYKNILFPPKIEIRTIPGDVFLSELYIEVKDPSTCKSYPSANVDETYNLRILTNYAAIEATSIWGALRGLETFSQLTYITDDNRLAINDSTVIVDYPRFPYRGLLVDTGRHFIPVPILKKQIDAMSYNKFNVLHWHIVDDQSFPLESKKYPNLTNKGRYTDSHVYTHKDVREIIDHARLRGVRVIPEFDTPGHVHAFGKEFPQFITVCWRDGMPYQAIYSVQGPAEILNPTLEGLYPVLKDILSEFNDLFVDEYIHLGNDEVYYDCWESNPQIQAWMENMNFTKYNQLEAYYSSKLLKIASDLKKKSVVWQDVYDNGVELDKSTIIQIWKDTATLPYHARWSDYLFNITRDGYQTILSSPWYINFISYGYQEWMRYYSVEPLANFTGDAQQAKLLIGGEAALWSEYVDGTNIATRLWPRASAIAERLWSDASVNNTENALFRLDQHRCRMLRRGIPAAPVLNGYCGDYEYGMKNSVVYEPCFNYGWPTL